MLLRSRITVLTGTALLATGGLLTGAAPAANAAEQPNPPNPPPPCVFNVPQPMATLLGGNGNDVLFGGRGVDVIYGLGGNDTIFGLGDNDIIIGGAGDDVIFGQGGDDDMLDGNGMDLLNGGPHFQGDRGDGGPGADSCPNTEVTISC